MRDDPRNPSIALPGRRGVSPVIEVAGAGKVSGFVERAER